LGLRRNPILEDPMTTRRSIFAALIAVPVTAGVTAAQPWTWEERRCIEWERWREAERRRRMREARRHRRAWREEMWQEERERAARERRYHR
jgi:hypothetical protein